MDARPDHHHVTDPRVPDRGSVGLFIVLLGLVFFVVVALVVDGSQHLRAHQRAHSVAAEAARQGGQAVVAGPAARGGRPAVDPTAARNAALAYLQAAGARGTAVVLAGDRLSVTATVDYTPLFGTLLGLGASADGEADVRLVRGLDLEI